MIYCAESGVEQKRLLVYAQKMHFPNISEESILLLTRCAAGRSLCVELIESFLRRPPPSRFQCPLPSPVRIDDLSALWSWNCAYHLVRLLDFCWYKFLLFLQIYPVFQIFCRAFSISSKYSVEMSLIFLPGWTFVRSCARTLLADHFYESWGSCRGSCWCRATGWSRRCRAACRSRCPHPRRRPDAPSSPWAHRVSSFLEKIGFSSGLATFQQTCGLFPIFDTRIHFLHVYIEYLVQKLGVECKCVSVKWIWNTGSMWRADGNPENSI